eukprot:6980936-Pyramimonas_sp.AAC.1
MCLRYGHYCVGCGFYCFGRYSDLGPVLDLNGRQAFALAPEGVRRGRRRWRGDGPWLPRARGPAGARRAHRELGPHL